MFEKLFDKLGYMKKSEYSGLVDILMRNFETGTRKTIAQQVDRFGDELLGVNRQHYTRGEVKELLRKIKEEELFSKK